jgi:hypothetical protein
MVIAVSKWRSWPSNGPRRRPPNSRASAGGTLYSGEREVLDPAAGLLAVARRRPLRRQVAQVGDARLRPGKPRVLVVLTPTARKQALHALDMRATVDRKEFFQFQHGDGRVKPIERTAAYRVVELRDYMFKFVDSLRTCGTPATS